MTFCEQKEKRTCVYTKTHTMPGRSSGNQCFGGERAEREGLAVEKENQLHYIVFCRFLCSCFGLWISLSGRLQKRCIHTNPHTPKLEQLCCTWSLFTMSWPNEGAKKKTRKNQSMVISILTPSMVPSLVVSRLTHLR